MSKITDATARPWKIGPREWEISDADGEVIASVDGESHSAAQDFADARLIVQAVNEREPLREMLFRALVELSYVQNVENCEGGLCASAEGKSIIEGGIKLLGVKDLSEDALKGEHNGD